MAGKFIPDSDHDFARMARGFSTAISADPEQYFLAADDAMVIDRAVTAFRERLALASRPMTRTRHAVFEKDAARREAERLVRQYGAMIRSNPEIERGAKVAAGVRERPGRLHRRSCPKVGPYLRFLGSESGAHLLEFRDQFGAGSRAKPRGASRVELLVELVEPGAALPDRPGARPWYLRSFSSSPMRVEYPQPESPRMVVYWGRWADATGQVGPWSKRVAARVEWGGAVSTAGAEQPSANEGGMRLAG